MTESRCFTVEFGGKCQLCGEWVPKGSQAHYVGDKFAHNYCHQEPNGKAYINSREDFGYEPTEPTYTVKGLRNHEKKCDCGITHAGECY